MQPERRWMLEIRPMQMFDLQKDLIWGNRKQQLKKAIWKICCPEQKVLIRIDN